MSKRAAAIEAEIDRRVAKTIAPDSPNRITGREVRDWAREYLVSVDEELQTNPEVADLPHWNLWMNDGRYQDALFVVLLFRSDCIEYFCGIGVSYDIIRESGTVTGYEDTVFDILSTQFDI